MQRLYNGIQEITMPGNYRQHYEKFGDCECQYKYPRDSTDTEILNLEYQDELGRWRTKKVPACSECFGLL